MTRVSIITGNIAGIAAVEAPGTASTVFNALRIEPSRPIVACYRL